MKDFADLCDLLIEWIREANMSNHTLLKERERPNTYNLSVQLL
jgi:hypothetical protein